MLKGLKKGKTTEQQNQQSKVHSNSHKIIDQSQQLFKNNQSIHNDSKLLSTNQGKIKEGFIIEDDEQNYLNFQKETQNKPKENDLISLKSKAMEILSFFQQGDEVNVVKELDQFVIMQKRYKKKQSQNRTLTQSVQKIVQGQIYEGFPVQQNQSIEKKEQNKGKFEYNFNYEQDEQDGNKKKSLKRSNKSRPIMRSQRIQDYCIYCPDNEEIRLISASNYVYLALPKRKTFQKYWHFILAPVEHQQTSIGLNQDVLTQLSNYKKCLLQMFDKKGYLVVFFQQYSQQNSHIYIECLAVPYTKGQDFPFFFKQSLQTIEGNWTTHNSLIKIQKQKGGLQRQIPKKIKYFYIDFSLGYGYAHVIENDKFWKRQFVYEVIATALGVQLYEVKTAAQFTDEELNKKQEQFKRLWEPYDWTKCL